MKNKNTIPVLDKAIAVLNRLSDEPDGITSAELATNLDIAPTTCYRILQTLMESNWVNCSGTRYKVSTGLLTLTRNLESYQQLLQSAQRPLEELANSTELVAKVSIRQGMEQVSLLRAEPPAPVSVTGKANARFPLVEGSVGVALLCDLKESEIDNILKRMPDYVQEKQEPEAFKQQLVQCNKLGWAHNPGDNRWQVYAVSAPIKDQTNHIIAAITLLGFKHEFTPERHKTVVAELLKKASECEELLFGARN